ncbi:EscU/YscU/HrcU family type III secretion system export apparatus switch protein [Alkalihalobacillus oceani]|uniref:EscU/YscU/HrcU family type III secretion system export apparatus switch protein n=1 Tax=Halalkalibacter oceani TaxID=1653776 RepID=UPI00203F9243|nr:EscU/YscU/HrcU family type III secretion system export apparatus switch protein [Halalkalibacter oceani]MCM3759431.1 EscU/YscU/HrcU family type III secretion system export apparatus switch protein [Halalkalibacter oceani]
MKQERKKQAVALRYQAETDVSPKVVAKGKGYVAEELIAKAQENDVPIQEDPSLVEMLAQLEVNQTIPPELYEVVAEVFSFIYKIDQHQK